MTNSWSFLYDKIMSTNEIYGDSLSGISTANGKDWENFWQESNNTVISGSSGTDTISFYGAASNPANFTGGIGDDHITLSGSSVGDNDCMPPWGHSDYEFLINGPNMIENRRQKYSEDVIIKELKDYITRTYDQHYSAGSDKIQTLDLIEACGDGEAFCRSNILKYASRYDKKGTARRDIMKILHYAVLLMHFNDKNAKLETYPQ